MIESNPIFYSTLILKVFFRVQQWFIDHNLPTILDCRMDDDWRKLKIDLCDWIFLVNDEISDVLVNYMNDVDNEVDNNIDNDDVDDIEDNVNDIEDDYDSDVDVDTLSIFKSLSGVFTIDRVYTDQFTEKLESCDEFTNVNDYFDDLLHCRSEVYVRYRNHYCFEQTLNEQDFYEFLDKYHKFFGNWTYR